MRELTIGGSLMMAFGVLSMLIVGRFSPTSQRARIAMDVALGVVYVGFAVLAVALIAWAFTQSVSP